MKREMTRAETMRTNMATYDIHGGLGRYIRHNDERMDDDVIPQVPLDKRRSPMQRVFGGKTGYAIPLTPDAAAIIGLDDPDRYRDLSRQRSGVKFCWYFGAQ